MFCLDNHEPLTRQATERRAVTCLVFPNDVQDMKAVEAPPHEHGARRAHRVERVAGDDDGAVGLHGDRARDAARADRDERDAVAGKRGVERSGRRPPRQQMEGALPVKYLAAALAAALIVLLGACSDDDDDDGNSGE